MGDIFSFEEYLTFRHRFQMCDHFGDRTLSGSGFSYNSKTFTPIQFETDIIYCCHGLLS